MKYRHYAPKTKCILVSIGNDQIKKINHIINENIIKNKKISFTINDGKTNLYKEFIKKIWKGFN